MACELGQSLFLEISSNANVIQNRRMLARALEVPDERIECIDHRCSSDVSEQCYQLLKEWKSVKGRHATTQALFRAMRDRGLCEIPDKYDPPQAPEENQDEYNPPQQPEENQDEYDSSQQPEENQVEQAPVQALEDVCITCTDASLNTVVQPCRHMCLCDRCGKILMEQPNEQRRVCPICRKRITEVQTIYKAGLPSIPNN